MTQANRAQHCNFQKSSLKRFEIIIAFTPITMIFMFYFENYKAKHHKHYEVQEVLD